MDNLNPTSQLFTLFSVMKLNNYDKYSIDAHWMDTKLNCSIRFFKLGNICERIEVIKTIRFFVSDRIFYQKRKTFSLDIFQFFHFKNELHIT